MADDDLFSGDADLADFLHQEPDHALAAPGLAADDDFAFFIPGADAPETQVPGNDADQAVDPPGLDQVMVGGQGEAGVDPVRAFVQVLFDLLKGAAFQDQVPGPPDQHGHFGSRCLGVNDGDLLVRVVFQQHVAAQAGAVVAAGQGAGDGKSDHGAGDGEPFPPDFRGGTGSLRHFGMAFVHFQHLIDCHVFIVNIFLAADPD